ncbi:transmembrane protein 181 isoform X2 [Neodiprion pinetum]|nr:transmembrane protein 181 isoform X2 [Neodiprion lecontei]XP_015515823.1 transmembrane protein 181 isoform X2 [Neodiprion lecontei]XP_046470177.1 transmembrane protein 181 isoform X2 [Neodiprion pinetum]XP_046470178.1 transmembrane protein 181 isoform X2 [Neodiprion pinetum]XP_046470179.1 transmembrane protein 181 isoform X2 [Neodiprion pinetum]XP_046470180.1 transmembrane protein 181 isoform X2 [Neodiprion pinetum]XP_046589000.1 transmembrane protein 181 isoform X2 [Neodiprion lecontei]X
MSKMNGASLGYSYHLPSGGWNFKIRNALSQFSDIFSEFNKYIAPAYHHDRCERSVQMRLYSMHKREFVMVFVAFFACFGLAVFIGLAGPPITSTTEQKAHLNGSEMATGPYIMRTPALSTYSQQLWVIAKLSTSNVDNEKYDESFQVSVSVDGQASDRKAVSILAPEAGHNRTRHLKCERQSCEELVVVHLGFLDYPHYIITVRFHGLESFYQRYIIRDLTFYFKNYNPAFTQIEIWFRLIFLLATFVVTCWFGHSLRKYPVHDWSIEQKWLSILLPLLILYNNPLFPMTFLVNSWVPGMLDAILQTTFLCAILMFWLCVYHGLRQNERRLATFYLPKLVVVGMLWGAALTLAMWLRCTELEDPTYNYVLDTSNYYGFKVFFFTVGGVYVAYLLLLILRAYSELRSMPYFDLRLRFLTLLAGVVAGVCTLVTTRHFGTGVFEDSFASRLSTYYRTSAQFMALYGLLNFYLYTMAYVYAPALQQVYGQHSSITKDNPAFSMINESDEDVIYGSDEESRRPLTRPPRNTDDSD